LAAGIAGINWRQLYTLAICCQELLGINDQDDLRPGIIGFQHPVESVRVNPKEDSAIEQLVPLGRSHPSQAAMQGRRRHWFLASQDHSLRKSNHVGAMLSFNAITSRPRNFCQV
jgi:hypothetical protein